MQRAYRNYDGKASYHRYFSSLRGVDFSSDPSEVSHSRFAHLENMWCDPLTPDGVATETFPGYRVFARFSAPIHAIFRHRTEKEDYLVVHAGTQLFRFPERLRNHEILLATLAPLPITLSSTRGCAFSHGESLYLLIGGEYIFIDKDGNISSLGQDPHRAYIPTTYFNGVPYEQRNVLSPFVRLSFTADGPYEATTGEDGLIFTVFNEADKSCSVRISERARASGKVTIPASATIGVETYTVKAIAPYGFAEMAGLVSVEIPSTVTVIASSAFLGDSSLRHINLPEGVTSIGEEAFWGCLSLAEIHLGKSLYLIGKNAFALCTQIREVRYSGTQAEYEAIKMEGENTLREIAPTVLYENEAPYEKDSVMYRYPCHEPIDGVLDVELNGVTLEENFILIDNAYCRYHTVSSGSVITHIEVTVTERSVLLGKKLTVTASLPFSAFSSPDQPGGKANEAVLGCTVVTKYDGRVFFSGNPCFPNTVFFSSLDETGQNNPLYVGVLNYFNDGTGAVPNRAMLVSGGLLAVCKAATGGEGEIFFHAARDSDNDLIPRIYPLTASIPSVGLCGSATTFAEEALILGKQGVFALTRCNSEGERTLSSRSGAINLRLARENTDNAETAVFEGLLYLLIDGSIYLADPRRPATLNGRTNEYEWYYLSGIGAYAGDRPVYRYTSYLPSSAEEYSVRICERLGEIAEGEVYSATLRSGEQIYYAQTPEGRFAVDTDGERTGGLFSPANRLLATDTALYFGTPDGALGCFNTDKRGQALYRSMQTDLYILKDEVYTPLTALPSKLFSEDMVEELPVYEKVGSTYVAKGTAPVFLDGTLALLLSPLGEYEGHGRIHRYYYSYAGHAYTASCMLATDDGGIPHYAKDTLPQSVVLKLKCPEGSALRVAVRTDRHPFRAVDTLRVTRADAGNSDFSAFDFHCDPFASVSVREKERGWCYKQYLFESTDFRAPFGLFSLSYSFRPTGRIKP